MTRGPAEYKQRANELFFWLAEGKLKFSGGITVVPLADAKKAHDMLEGRHTTGKVLLQPYLLDYVTCSSQF